MSFVRIDLGLILLSVLVALGTGISTFLRFRRESTLNKTVADFKKHLKRRIVHLTVEEKKEGVIDKTLESFQGWVSKKRVIGAEKKDSSVEARRLLRKAEVYAGRKEYPQAEKYLIEALSLDENNKEINKKLALVYLKQQKYPKAELVYLRLIEQGSHDSTVYSNLGLVLYNENRLDMAIKAYQKAIDIDPKRAARYANVGQIYYELQDINSAILYFEQAFKWDNKNIDYMFILAKLYEEKNVKEKAKFFYHKILDIEPYNEEAKEGIRNLL
jgi:tetratricopeptide (TPR) repeat protein